MKKNSRLLYLVGLLSLILGMVFMKYLVRVYFAFIVIFFFLILFQTPLPKVDKTGEINDAKISILRVIGLSTLLFLAGGYIALIFL